jgi:phospholipase C
MRTNQSRLLTATALALCTAVSAFAQQPPDTTPPDSTPTRTPIKHVVIILGENRTFDHLLATYQPPPDQTVWNLLSEGIIQADGSPGANYTQAVQNNATTTPDNTYSQSPPISGPYETLPPPYTGSAPLQASDTSPPPFATIAAAQAADHGVYPSDLVLLTTGATGLPTGSVDTRITNVNSLPPGPYQLTNGATLTYDDYAGSPVHRFYQMWQQTDCNVSYATPLKPSGCKEDLFPWVEVTVSAGSNGTPPTGPVTNATTKEGAIAMGFYNVQAGDEPFNNLARQYTLADNYHQAVMGGTGANHIMLGSGDAYWYSDGHGNPATPPTNEIENPTPYPGTVNWYTQDGYISATEKSIPLISSSSRLSPPPPSATSWSLMASHGPISARAGTNTSPTRSILPMSIATSAIRSSIQRPS